MMIFCSTDLFSTNVWLDDGVLFFVVVVEIEMILLIVDDYVVRTSPDELANIIERMKCSNIHLNMIYRFSLIKYTSNEFI
jgi:hypothetical protein